MSVTITVTIKDLDKIQAKFKQAPVAMTRELGLSVSRIMEKIWSETLRLAPVNKQSGGGNLRQSIRGMMIGVASARIEVGAAYGIFVHEGTAPHTINVVNRRVLANKRSGQIFGTRVQHPGTRANPFLRTAVEQNQSFIDKEFENLLNRVIK